MSADRYHADPHRHSAATGLPVDLLRRHTAGQITEGGRPAVENPDADALVTTCRIGVDARGLGGCAMDRWRLLLVADVLRRLLQVMHGRRVLLVVVERAGSINNPPMPGPAARVSCPDEATAALGGPASFVVEPVRPRLVDGWRPGPRILQVGAVAPPTRREIPVFRDQDPAAVRLALLRFAPTCPAVLSAARLHRAEETVRRWRLKVAMWHDTPPAPQVPGVVDAARAAFHARLDTTAVLRHLHRLEIDQHVASGSKFETFTRLDRVLGLDLGHLIGKLLR